MMTLSCRNVMLLCLCLLFIFLLLKITKQTEHSALRKTISSNVLGKKYATHLTSTSTPSGVNRLLLQCHIHNPKGKGIRISKLSNFCDYQQIAIILQESA